MIIYWSMIAVIAICAAGKSLSETNTKLGSKFLVYFPMLYIIFWTGVRTQFVDTSAYIRVYDSIPADSFQSIYKYTQEYDKDQLFYFLSGVFKYIFGNNYHYWLFAIALLCGMCVIRQIYKYSDSPFFSLYLFMTMSIFTWLMNGIRQFIVISILFTFSDWLIDKRKRWIYIILIILLSFIHNSALFILPFIIVVMFAKPWDWKMILMIIAIVVVISYADPFFNFLTEAVAQDYAETLDEYGGTSILRTLVAFVPIVLSFAGRKIIQGENNQYLNLCVNMSLVSALIYALSSFTNGILIGRMPMYFQVYDLLLLPWLIKHCFTKQSRQLLTIVCIVCYLIYFVYQAVVAGNYYYASDLTGFLGSEIW